MIATSGNCIIPRRPQPPPVSAFPISPAASVVGAVIDSARIVMIPEYHGKVIVDGHKFSLSYDDVPDRYLDADGKPLNVASAVAWIPDAEFLFTFRRVGP